MKMKNLFIKTLTTVCFVLFVVACDNFVDDIDPLVNEIEDTQLDSEEQIELLINGLLGTAGSTGDQGVGIGRILWRASGYSDEMIHGVILGGAPDHTSFVQDFPPDLGFYEGDWTNYHDMRFLGDDLVRRVGRIGTFDNTALRDKAIWWGNFMSGLMRLYLADHWGAQATTGLTPGAPITTAEQLTNGEFGAFFTDTELHEQAREKFMAIMGVDPGNVPNSDKVLWSLIARTHLFDANYSAAKSAADQGLQQGDETLEILQNLRFPNQFWLQSGRTNDTNEFLFSVHPRFIQYVLDDRLEGEIISELIQENIDDGIISQSLRGPEGDDGEPGNSETSNPRSGLTNQNERLPLWEKLIETGASAIGDDTEWATYKDDGAICTQDIYSSADAPLIIIDWREVELILAEVAINGSDNNTALTHINNVRTHHGLTPAILTDLTSYDNPLGGAAQSGIAVKGALSTDVKVTGALGYLIEERDKTLMFRGTRLADQKRFGLWHLEGDSYYKFYMPIPRSETDVNPNIPAG
jgi:hypothetical protein